TCWSNWFTAAGYRAALSGKTHVNPPRVFDYEHLMTPKAVSEGHDPDFGAVDDFLADCVRKNQNFGLYICSTQPHAPWNKGDPSKYPPDKLQLPPNFVDTPETREAYSRYLAEITYFDGQVGRALDLLDKHGLAGDTMVVVLTEQGSAFPFAKWTCYDAGVTSGMVVRWPGHVNPGGTSDALVEYIDIMPTFCEAAKIRTPGDLDGRSFLGLLKGATGRHKDYAFSLATSRGLNNGPECYGVRSVRGARHRYILNLSPGETFVNWTTLQPWYEQWREKAAAGDKHAAGMVKRYQHRPAEELYDVEKDPWCLDNIMGDPSLKDELATLRRQLAAWMKDQGDKGQATEMAAKDRLWKNARENPGRKN
ncbi:MAG: sulfatase-like hydrolase/transferase, partial [Opitutaceae bacterium]|nr:sulfatase-like hydrolase/transferase [Opitutaceae bacterium]